MAQKKIANFAAFKAMAEKAEENATRFDEPLDPTDPYSKKATIVTETVSPVVSISETKEAPLIAPIVEQVVVVPNQSNAEIETHANVKPDKGSKQLAELKQLFTEASQNANNVVRVSSFSEKAIIQLSILTGQSRSYIADQIVRRFVKDYKEGLIRLKESQPLDEAF